MGEARCRLWAISELYYPEQTSTGYFLTRIAEGLAADFDVQVICGQPTYSERGIKAPARETRNGAHIRRMSGTHFDKDRLAGRALNAITVTTAMFVHALVNFRRGDRVLVVTNPPIVPAMIGLVARWRGCPATLLVHDLYPEVLGATGMLRPTRLSYRILARFFRWSFRLFGDVVVLGRDMAEVVRAKIDDAHRRIHLIPNWGDVDEIRPIAFADNAFRQEHGLAEKFVVQFSGNIGRTHDVELVLDTARLLRDRDDIVFLFVGYGGKAGLLADADGNVRFLPRQPREKLAQMLAASNVTIISFIDGMYGISVPSRMYNVMAAGVPIIAAADERSELARTVADLGAGWVLHDRTPEGLAALIRSLASVEGRANLAARGAAGRRGVEQRYALPHILQQYRQLLGQPQEL